MKLSWTFLTVANAGWFSDLFQTNSEIEKPPVSSTLSPVTQKIPENHEISENSKAFSEMNEISTTQATSNEQSFDENLEEGPENLENSDEILDNSGVPLAVELDENVPELLPLNPQPGLGPLPACECPNNWTHNENLGICWFERTWFPYGISQRIAERSCNGFQPGKGFRDIEKSDQSQSVIFTPLNQEENDFMHETFGTWSRPYTPGVKNCGCSWLGIEKVNGVWQYGENERFGLSGTPIQYSNWNKDFQQPSCDECKYAFMTSDGTWRASTNKVSNTKCSRNLDFGNSEEESYFNNVICVMSHV